MHKRYENCVPNLPMHKMKNYDRGVVQFNICPKVRGLLAHENLKFLKFKTRDFEMLYMLLINKWATTLWFDKYN